MSKIQIFRQIRDFSVLCGAGHRQCFSLSNYFIRGKEYLYSSIFNIHVIEITVPPGFSPCINRLTSPKIYPSYNIPIAHRRIVLDLTQLIRINLNMLISYKSHIHTIMQTYVTNILLLFYWYSTLQMIKHVPIIRYTRVLLKRKLPIPRSNYRKANLPPNTLQLTPPQNHTRCTAKAQIRPSHIHTHTHVAD